MKLFFLKNRNVVLFILLLFAIGITYVFEEKYNLNKDKDEKQRMSVLSAEEFGNLKSFQGIKLNIKKIGDKYYSADNELLLSSQKLDEFFKVLGGLRIKKFLTEAEVKNIEHNNFIPNADLKMSFSFEKGVLRFSLGKKLDYDQSFYMEVEKEDNGTHLVQKKIVIATDESPDPNVYQSENEYKKSDFKYQRLQMLFYLTNAFFYESHVFHQFPYEEKRINFKKMEIATFRNKKFSLDFEKSVTLPEVFNGYVYFDENWISFHRTLTQLEGKMIYYPFQDSLLTEPLSMINVEDRDGKKYTLELYKKYGSLPGYFLKTSFNKILYELRTEEAKYFLVNVQDFWQKKISLKEKEYSLRMEFLGNNKDTYEVQIIDKEIFDVIYPSKKVRLSEFKKLIDFLKMESDHLGDFQELDPHFLQKIVLKLYFANRNLGVILEENDVVLADLDNKVALHHYVGSQVPFGIKFSDYFEK